MKTTKVRIMRLPHGTDLPLPAYQSEHAAGLDLVAAVPAPVSIAPGAWASIPTGIAIALPRGQVVSRRQILGGDKPTTGVNRHVDNGGNGEERLAIKQ